MLPLVLIAGIFACASSSGLKFNPGTYQGTAPGFGGDITMEVTVSSGAILSVKVISQSDTPEISKQAFERIPLAIMTGQTLAVDTVSGATLSSNGIIAATSAALAKSGVDIAALKSRKPIIEQAIAQLAKTETTDVVVVGGGGAGLAAAMSAHQNGAKVIILEKLPQIGGNTALSGQAFNGVNPELQSQLNMTDANRRDLANLLNKTPAHDKFEADLQQTVKKQYDDFLAAKKPGLFDSPEWHMLQTYNGGDYVGKPELIKTLAENVPATRQWLTDNGMKWSDSPDINVRIFQVLGGLWERATRPAGVMGQAFIETGSNYIKKNSGQITLMLETRATELIVLNGKVIGVKATSPNGELTINATKGVVLACGGFGANVEMREKYNKHWPSLLQAKSTNAPGATGDGMLMAEKIGANLYGMEWIQLLPMGDPNTGSLSGNIEQGVQDRFFVNKKGDRFVNEAGRRDDMTKALLEQPDSWLWVICDSRSYPNPDTTKNNFGETINGLIANNRAFGANTIEELAAKINVPPANLRKALDEFNAGVDAGSDKWGRLAWRDKINKPPYYAGARIPTVHHTMGGIEINASAQVLNKSGQVIPGLYAAGETAGGLHGTNRLGGNALADIHTFGRIAGASAAKGL